jgi:hypothetical protein
MRASSDVLVLGVGVWLHWLRLFCLLVVGVMCYIFELPLPGDAQKQKRKNR